MFEKVKKIHLEEYLPVVIDQFGHAILHGDGNIFVDDPEKELKHQPSYLAKEYAATKTATDEPEAKYSIRFTSVDQIPDSLEKLETMFLNARAKEKANLNKQKESPGILTMNLTKKEEVKNNEEVESKSEIVKNKPGRKPNK